MLQLDLLKNASTKKMCNVDIRNKDSDGVSCNKVLPPLLMRCTVTEKPAKCIAESNDVFI